MNSPIIPVLPLRDIVVFPQMVVPLFVGRKLSVNALNNVMKYNKKILLIAQKNSEIDDPKKTPDPGLVRPGVTALEKTVVCMNLTN